MPHSPYTKQVHPPISDNELETFSDSLQRIRYEQEQGRYDEYAVDTPLNIGEALIEHCEFLEAKLKIKVCKNQSTPSLYGTSLAKALSTAADTANFP